MSKTKVVPQETIDQVIAMRKMKSEFPELSALAIKRALDLPQSETVIARTLRGILYANVDMCGLEAKPASSKSQTEAPASEESASEESASEAPASEAPASEASASEEVAKTPKTRVPTPLWSPKELSAGYRLPKETPLHISAYKGDEIVGRTGLTANQISAIWNARVNGADRKPLSKLYNTSVSTVRRIERQYYVSFSSASAESIAA